MTNHINTSEIHLTLEDARYCLSEKSNGCMGCKYARQSEIDCRREALKIGENCINLVINQNEHTEKLQLAEKHFKYGR